MLPELVEQAPTSKEFARVSSAYLREASNARTLRIASREDAHTYTSLEPRGYHDLEFNQADVPEALLLVDFIDEFKESFSRTRLDDRYFASPVPLFTDRYGDLVICLANKGKELAIIDIPDKQVRLEAYRYLSRKTVPKLWPEVVSDHFRPRRVVELEERRGNLIVERRQLERDVEEQIQQELSFFARFAPLTELADDPLKDLVRAAFEEVFACDVVDLDADLVEGEAKHLDLMVSKNGWKCLVEVRSSSNRGAHKSEVERIDDHVPRAEEKYGSAGSKLFVFNGLYYRPAAGRTDNVMFNDPVVDEAKLRGTTLMSTFRLLDAIECRRNGEISDEQFIEAIRAGGVVQPFRSY